MCFTGKSPNGIYSYIYTNIHIHTYKGDNMDINDFYELILDSKYKEKYI